jgi:hypothetical protein
MGFGLSIQLHAVQLRPKRRICSTSGSPKSLLNQSELFFVQMGRYDRIVRRRDAGGRSWSKRYYEPISNR